MVEDHEQVQQRDFCLSHQQSKAESHYTPVKKFHYTKVSQFQSWTPDVQRGFKLRSRSLDLFISHVYEYRNPKTLQSSGPPRLE